MRSGLVVLLAVISGCRGDSDKTATKFCTGVQLTFKEPVILVGAREVVSARRGRCSMLNEASQSLGTTIVSFEAAADAFRQRPEVGRTLAALDKLPLAQVHALHCDEGGVSEDQTKALLVQIDQVLAKLAAVNDACWSG